LEHLDHCGTFCACHCLIWVLHVLHRVSRCFYFRCAMVVRLNYSAHFTAVCGIDHRFFFFFLRWNRRGALMEFEISSSTYPPTFLAKRKWPATRREFSYIVQLRDSRCGRVGWTTRRPPPILYFRTYFTVCRSSDRTFVLYVHTYKYHPFTAEPPPSPWPVKRALHREHAASEPDTPEPHILPLIEPF
jgi:hypothetical protein